MSKLASTFVPNISLNLSPVLRRIMEHREDFCDQKLQICYFLLLLSSDYLYTQKRSHRLPKTSSKYILKILKFNSLADLGYIRIQKEMPQFLVNRFNIIFESGDFLPVCELHSNWTKTTKPCTILRRI